MTKTAVLLGAGASRDAGVPTTTEMTERIYLTLTPAFYEQDTARRIRRALGTVIGGLIFQRGTKGDNPYEGLDVEEVFASVQMLANRSNIEAAPFIGSWHDVIDQLEEEPISDQEFDKLYRDIRGGISEEVSKILHAPNSPLKQIQREYNKQATKKPPKFEWDKWIGSALSKVFRELKNSKPPARSRQDIRKSLGGIVRRDPDSRQGEIFERLAEHMILSLRDLVWLGENRDVSHLLPLLELSSKRLSIYSLNYDNAIELLCQQKDLNCSVGITESGALEFDAAARVHLVKLHGSIDWVETEPESDEYQNPNRPLPLKGIRLATSDEMKDKEQVFRPAIIFGQGNKLTAEGPYLELLRIFRNDLEEHNRLLVVGYSFRDDHVNHYIAWWFNGGPDRRIVILNGEGFYNDAPGIVPFARNLIRRGGERIHIIRKTAAQGLRQAVDELNA